MLNTQSCTYNHHMLLSHVSCEKIFQKNNHCAPREVLTGNDDIDQHFDYRGQSLHCVICI